jgi:hypothetical protein
LKRAVVDNGVPIVLVLVLVLDSVLDPIPADLRRRRKTIHQYIKLLMVKLRWHGWSSF